MQISERTKQILKNYASVNQNVVISSGNKIRTISQAKTVYAECDVEETFPEDFAIYDLNEFLGALSLFKDPELDFDGKKCTISSGKNSIRYLSADPNVLIYPKKALTLKEPISTFTTTPEVISSALKAAGVLKSPFITFSGDGSAISLIAHDKSNENSNRFNVEVAENDTKFQYHVKTEYLGKLLGEDFTVEILPGKLLVFRGDKKMYMIASEADSTLES